MLAAAADTRTEHESLASLYAPLAIAVFVLVALALAVPLVRDRAARRSEPSPRTSSSRLEVGYAVVLALVAALLGWKSLEAIAAVRPVGGPALSRSVADDGAPAEVAGDRGAAVVVDAVAAKWSWRFEYPGGVVSQGTPQRPAVLTVPTDARVRVHLTSRDVAHALWIPEARTKYDAYPGYVNAFDVRFQPGVRYDQDRCSEFCGTYHVDMTFDVRTLEPARFARWLQAERRRAAASAAGAGA